MTERSIRLFGCALFALAVAVASPDRAAAGAGNDGLIVGFDPRTSPADRAAIVERAGGTVRRRLRAVRALSLTPRRGVSLAAVRRALGRSPGVEYVEKDAEVIASVEPADPFYATQYGLSQPNDVDIDAPEAWETVRSCAKVAVLDSGTDVRHPDLEPNLWRNTEEKPSNGKDDDDNGYVDDDYGVDLVGGRGSGVDDNGHGTHVAGIVGAVGDNGVGVTGVCWKASILSVKFLDERGRGKTSGAIEAIEYAIREGARILNCSFGTSSESEALEDAVDYAKKKGALLVVAAGNDGDDIDRAATYPASFGHGNIVAVAATTEDDRLASFSNYGDDTVDVAAPGTGIYSTYPDNRYRAMDGTSMAAPYVAGAAGLLKKVEPDATYEQLRTALRKKVDTPPALENKVVYDGRLNVRRALSYFGG